MLGVLGVLALGHLIQPAIGPQTMQYSTMMATSASTNIVVKLMDAMTKWSGAISKFPRMSDAIARFCWPSSNTASARPVSGLGVV